MEFLFECLTTWLTSERSEWVRFRVEHEERNFISTSNHVLFCFSYKLDKPFTDKKNQLYSSVIFDILKDQKRVESYCVKSRCIESCWSLPWNKTFKNHGIGWPHYWGKFRNVGKKLSSDFHYFCRFTFKSVSCEVNNFIGQ